MKKTGADECDAAAALTLLLNITTLVNIYVASWLTGPHQENRRPQNSLIHVTSIRRAHKLGQQTRQQNVLSENYETQPYAVRTLCPAS